MEHFYQHRQAGPARPRGPAASLCCLQRLTATLLMSLAVLLSALLPGCATIDLPPVAPLEGHVLKSVANVDLHQISPPMRSFLQQYVAPYQSRADRSWALVWSLLDRNILPFDYDPQLTLTAGNTFDRGSGNCLAFSSLFIAMARAAGLDAWYQEVEVPPQWSSSNNTLLVSLHVNAVLEHRGDQWVIDVSGEKFTSSRRTRRISDDEALAQYYNNFGAEALTRDDLALAYAYFVKAIETEPVLAYLWSNLGVVYSRNGQVDAARRSYQAAIAINPAQSIAANNLFLIYQSEGDLEAARRLQAQVDRHRRKNPYYLYHLSTEAMAQGRYAETVDILDRAIQLNDKEYAFHYQRARAQVLNGDLENAGISLRKAIDLAPADSPVQTASLDFMPELPE